MTHHSQVGSDSHRPTRRRALVTGASSGIGEALAVLLAERGHEVWLLARREPELEEIVTRIRNAGGAAHAVVADVSASDDLFERVRDLDAECGGFDICIANAGSGRNSPVSETPWSEIRQSLDVNATGAIATIAAVLPAFLARGRGRLVGITSLTAMFEIPGAAAYAAGKACTAHFLGCLHGELRGTGVTVTCARPGFVRTAMIADSRHPTPFATTARKAATEILDAAERGRLYVETPAAWRWISRCARLLPSPVRRALAARVATTT